MPQRLIRRSAVCFAAAFVLLSLLSFAARAQEPPGEFGSEVDVSEVLLDVRVTDSQGNVILGLGPDDFVVREDGERRPVETVSFYSNRRLEGPIPKSLEGKVSQDGETTERYFVLLFDDQRRSDLGGPANLMRRQLDAGRQAKAWVRTLPPSDRVAVLSYDAKLKVQTDFTADRQQLEAAIDAAVQGKDLYGGNWPSRAGDTPAERSLLAGLPQGEALDKQSRRLQQAIETIAEAAGEIRGRKNLILFSSGFGEVNRFGQYIPDQRYYPPMMRALNDNNVAVYTIDLVPTEVQHELSNAMNVLSEDTGGRYFFNFTSFRSPLEQIEDTNSGYYLLSYRSPHERGTSGYQEVEVETRNPEFRVDARQGYLYGAGG